MTVNINILQQDSEHCGPSRVCPNAFSMFPCYPMDCLIAAYRQYTLAPQGLSPLLQLYCILDDLSLISELVDQGSIAKWDEQIGIILGISANFLVHCWTHYELFHQAEINSALEACRKAAPQAPAAAGGLPHPLQKCWNSVTALEAPSIGTDVCP